MKFTKVNDEVLYSTENIVKVDALDINELKEKARLNHRKRVRLCAHKTIDEKIHEMLIIHEKSCYVRPHKHINKVESFHIIEGRVDILLFDENGRINNLIPMGDYASGRKFFYRLPPSHFHTLIIRSEVLVFHEITNGPFNPDDTVWANWAPEETAEDKVSEYKAFLENLIVEKQWA
jgi:cupin fold WbuC family metalloprotein